MIDVFSRFPKARKSLPQNYQDIYEKEYIHNRSNKGLVNKIKTYLESWMHKECSSVSSVNILEVGAGTLNHIQFEKVVKNYDIVEPNKFLYDKSLELKKVTNIFDSIKKIPEKKQYDKIVSIAVFEHIENLPLEMARLGNKLLSNGILQTAIPTEGGFFWGFSWRISTGISFYLKYKLNYKIMMRYEHINNEEEIIELHKLFFNEVKIKRFPSMFKHLSLYTVIEAKNPKKEAIEEFLKNE